ncbi:MAG TPA: SDR family oxidoreductase [Candidatus Limnocylindrales bacterium]|nr:SDR family oxidoreductase [Candidatus Limnocylindrales bacterium]
MPVAVVTGGAQGIGRACADRLRADGWQVVVGDIQAGPGVVPCDVTVSADVSRLFDQAHREHGGVDALVNAAGMGRPSKFLEASDEFWVRHLEVNLMGTVRACRAAIPLLRASTHPTRGIVNFTSQAAKSGGLVIGAPYSAAKAAVLCLTKTLAAEFSPEGIRVNAVAPGIIDTAFLDGVPAVRERGPQLPLRRIGKPEEVASVVAFLLSPDASYLTGEIVDVNGGLLMD